MNDQGSIADLLRNEQFSGGHVDHDIKREAAKIAQLRHQSNEIQRAISTASSHHSHHHNYAQTGSVSEMIDEYMALAEIADVSDNEDLAEVGIRSDEEDLAEVGDQELTEVLAQT